MVLTVFGESFPCAKAVKGDDFVRLYDEGGACIYTASPIADFAPYSLEGGAWSAPEMSESERIAALEDIVAALIYGGVSE